MDKRIFMLLGAVIVIGGVVLLLQYFAKPHSVDCSTLDATIYPTQVVIENGDSISFTDNTPNSNRRHWDFGDKSGMSDQKSGKYLYSQKGTYTIILTVNGSCTRSFQVDVKSYTKDADKITLKILPPTGNIYVGQRVQFNCEVSGNQEADSLGKILWNWKFGETGKTDSKEQNPFTVFNSPGPHTITLSMSKSLSAATLEVNVLIKPVAVTSNGAIRKIATPSTDEIKSHLQKMADSGLPTKDDYPWMRANFTLGRITPLKTNISSEISNLDQLINEFAQNSNVYQVKEIKIVTNPQTGQISSLTVNAQKK